MLDSRVLLLVLGLSVQISWQLQCDVPGFCIGSSLGLDPNSDLQTCKVTCTENSGCVYWTFDSLDGFCTIYKTCDSINPDCTTCISGESGCDTYADTTTEPPTTTTTEPAPLIKDILFLTGGIPAGKGVEALSLSNSSLTCEPIADYPFYVYNHIGTTYRGRPVACGDSTPIVDCYTYNRDGEWELFMDNMTEPRAHAFSVQKDETEFIIMGGGKTEQSSTDHFLPSTETFADNFVLPFNLSYACSGMLNDTHLYVTGGYKNNLAMTGALLFYDILGDEWTHMDDMPTPRYYHGCGTTDTDIGTEIVVAGGGSTISSTEIYNLSINKWRAGPDLPFGNRGQASVQYKDTFLLAGGIAITERTKILEFDWRNEQWVYLDQEMQTQRYGQSAVLVSSNVVECV